MVRAKFKCMEIKHAHSGSADYSAATVTLIPVWGDGKANDQWSKATPSGKLEMLITNPAAVSKFELGREYYLDFTPAE